MRKEASTNFENEQLLSSYCKAYQTLLLIAGRWKLSILFVLTTGSASYTQLKNLLPQMSDRILSLQIKELCLNGLVTREKNKNRSIYYLSDRGLQFKKVLNIMSSWEDFE